MHVNVWCLTEKIQRLCCVVPNAVDAAAVDSVVVCLQMEEETQRFMQEKDERSAQLLERQANELQQFDLETSTMGLDALQIRDESEQTYLDEDLDTMSTRGSMLSLTPSASTNSFVSGASGGGASDGGAYGGGGGRMTPPMSITPHGQRVSLVGVSTSSVTSSSSSSRQPPLPPRQSRHSRDNSNSSHVSRSGSSAQMQTSTPTSGAAAGGGGGNGRKYSQQKQQYHSNNTQL